MNRTPYITEDQREAWEASVVDNKAPEPIAPLDFTAPAATGQEPAQQLAGDTAQAQ